MEDNIYSKLRSHLDTFVLAAPESDSLLEILRVRFTPEEAAVALILGHSPEELSVLAKSSNMSESSLRSILEQMADKALVFKETKSVGGVTKELYSLLPTAVGLWETSFATGERNPRTELLARLWREYYKSSWGKYMHAGKTPITRVIPVGRSIAPQQEVYSYERASELIKEQDYACVIHCPCRKSAELDGKGCGRPTEVCVHFGNLARFLVDKGYAREVSQKETLEILDVTEKAGLVHMVANSKEMGIAICSCCACCCTQLRAIAEMPKPDAIAKSRFMAEVDAERCTSCEICEERCWVNAITFGDDVARVDGQRCIGCGLCVTACPVEAISLKEREGVFYQEPLATGLDLGKALVEERIDQDHSQAAKSKREMRLGGSHD